MDEYWATRTGRWRKAMQSQSAPSFAERLFAVVRADITAGALPAGALLPPAERVSQELAIDAADVRSAYARLLADGLIAERNGGVLFIPGSGANGHEASVGDATQIRFEAALLKAVREAAARGLSSSEATGIFKAALVRLNEMERRGGSSSDDEQ
jgi:DNA-binding FadR family transcriptional regulator